MECPISIYNERHKKNQNLKLYDLYQVILQTDIHILLYTKRY